MEKLPDVPTTTTDGRRRLTSFPVHEADESAELVGVRAGGSRLRLQAAQESEPTHGQRAFALVRSLSFDLVTCDDLAGSARQFKYVHDEDKVTGGCLEDDWTDASAYLVGKIGTAFFEQGCSAMACQCLGFREQLIEHGRSSKRGENGKQSTMATG